MNFLYLESSGSWGGQEYRTCLEINWLNAHGHGTGSFAIRRAKFFQKRKNAIIFAPIE